MSDLIHTLKQGGLSLRELSASEDSGQYIGIVSDLGTETSLRRLLSILSNDQLCLTEVARQSYKHHNGYDRIELFPPSYLGYGVRLHIWWSDERSDKEHIHTHPWDFASSIILGTLNFEQFAEDSEGEDFFVNYYDRPTAKTSYVLRSGGVGKLKKTFGAALVSGCSYVARRPFIHRVDKTPNVNTATIMVHGPELDYPTRIFTKEPLAGNNSVIFSAERFTPKQILERVKRLQTALNGIRTSSP